MPVLPRGGHPPPERALNVPWLCYFQPWVVPARMVSAAVRVTSGIQRGQDGLSALSLGYRRLQLMSLSVGVSDRSLWGTPYGQVPGVRNGSLPPPATWVSWDTH